LLTQDETHGYRRLRLEVVALGCVEDHRAEVFPIIALGKDSLADGCGAESAVFLWSDYEDEFVHGMRVRFGGVCFKGGD
jgi:hypothetical protein